MRKLILIFSALLPLASPGQDQADAVQAPLQADPGEDYFLRAKQLYENAQNAGNASARANGYRRTIPILRDYVREFPRHKNTQAAYYYLGEALYETRQLNKAKPIFRLIIGRYKKGRFVSAAAYRLAYDHYSQNRYAEAAKLFAITAKNAPQPEDQVRADYSQAQCYLILNRIKTATPILERIAASQTTSSYRDKAFLTLGHIYLNKKEYTPALKNFQNLITNLQAPQVKAEASLHAGIAAAALDKVELAESLYKTTLQTPESTWIPKAHVALLGLYYQRKDYQAILTRVKQDRIPLEPALLAKQGVIVGRTNFKLKNYSSAISYFSDVEKSVSGTEEAFEAAYYKILCYYNLGHNKLSYQVDNFIANYAVGRGTHKYIHQALLIKAETLYADKNFKAAAKTYNSIDTKLIDPVNLPSLLYKKGWCFSEIGNHAGAASAFSQLIQNFPEDKRRNEALTMRGQSYMELDDRLNALKDFDQVISNTPKSILAEKSIQSSARIQQKSKDYKDMISRYNLLLTNFPQLNYIAKANANYWIGWGHFKLEQFKTAPPFLEKAIELEKTKYSEPALMIIILCKYHNRDIEGVKKAVEQAADIKLYSKIPLSIFRWLGSQCYNAGEFIDAARYLRSGVEKGVPKKTPLVIWRLLSKSQLQAGLHQEALKSINNVLASEKENPRIVDAKLDKSKILIALKRYGDARLIADEALALRPVGKIKAGLLMAMGDIEFATSKFNEAAQNYVLLVSNFSELNTHPQALHRLSLSLEKSGQPAEAETYRKELKQKYPDFKPDPEQ